MTRGLQAASSDDPQVAGCEPVFSSRCSADLWLQANPSRTFFAYVRYRRRALAESKFDPRGFGPRLAPCLRPGALSHSPKVIPSRTPSATVRTILIPRHPVPLSSWAVPPLFVGNGPLLYVGVAPSIRGRSPLYTWA